MNCLFKIILRNQQIIFQHVRKFRNKGYCKGKPPGEAPNIQQILKKLNAVDESIHYKVDIGLPYSHRPSQELLLERKKLLKNNLENKNLERLSRNDKLRLSLDDVGDEWLLTEGPFHIKRIAEHYGIFKDLFGDAFFHSVTPMRISYKISENNFVPVYYGNIVKPSEAKNCPVVEIGEKQNMFHSLMFLNLDGHLNKQDTEYIHWFVGNISNSDVNKGETFVKYLQPFPTKGTGYHRYVFVLFEHPKKLNFREILKENNYESNNHEERNFCTYNFYRGLQDEITPSSLSFFQSDWDSSVTKVFHNIFCIQEPKYEYDFADPYIHPQRWFPTKRAFNTYLDMYRDPKQISKEVLLKKFKTYHPFKKPNPPSRYPNAHTPFETQGKPSWLQVEIKKERFGWGRAYNQNKDILEPK